jgi:hypothetical protein
MQQRQVFSCSLCNLTIPFEVPPPLLPHSAEPHIPNVSPTAAHLSSCKKLRRQFLLSVLRAPPPLGSANHILRGRVRHPPPFLHFFPQQLSLTNIRINRQLLPTNTPTPPSIFDNHRADTCARTLLAATTESCVSAAGATPSFPSTFPLALILGPPFPIRCSECCAIVCCGPRCSLFYRSRMCMRCCNTLQHKVGAPRL